MLISSGRLSKAQQKAELGRSTWTLLHNMAAKYPLIPSLSVQQEYNNFIHFLAKNYPCYECSQDFQEILALNPPKVLLIFLISQLKSNQEFQSWLCMMHNLVNYKLGKAEFPCSQISERWDCGCSLD